MTGYIRIAETPDDPWPFPMEEGWISVQLIDEKGQPVGVRTTVPREQVITGEDIFQKVLSVLRTRGWKPPAK